MNCQAVILSAIVILLNPETTMQNPCHDFGVQFNRSWQSSSFAHLNGKVFCGFGGRGKQGFLHTAIGTTLTDQGYHWIVLKLASPVVISTVVTRSGGFNGTVETFQRRAKDVEVWTSAKEIDFGGETCSSGSISSVFSNTRDSWKWCGRNSLRIGQDVFHAQCSVIHEVRVILLRKYVTNISASEEQSLSFENIFLIRANVTAEIQPSEQVTQNSSVKLRCNIVCADNITEFTSRVRLCHSNSNLKCHASGNQTYHIASVQPNHSGTYSCMIGDEVLSIVQLNVLYPPNQLSLSLDGCKARSAQIAIKFESSASYPVPHHQCQSINDSDTNLLKSSHSQENLSFWTCPNCSLTGNLAVQCTAVQKCNLSTTKIDCSTHEVLWTSTVEKLLKSNCSSENDSFVISIVVPTIAIVIIILTTAKQKIIIRWLFHHTTTTTPTSHSKPNACYPPIELSPHHTPPDAKTQENVNSEATTVQNSEACTYATVMHGDGTLGLRMTRAESVHTLYLDIVADGAEEADG